VYLYFLDKKGWQKPRAYIYQILGVTIEKIKENLLFDHNGKKAQTYQGAIIKNKFCYQSHSPLKGFLLHTHFSAFLWRQTHYQKQSWTGKGVIILLCFPVSAQKLFQIEE